MAAAEPKLVVSQMRDVRDAAVEKSLISAKNSAKI